MALNIGIDFGTSNSGVAVSDGQTVHLLPIDKKNLVPEVVKTILYITRDHRYVIGQEAVETYYRQNVNRLRRFVKQRVGEIDYRGADMFYVTDVFAYVDELQPGRLLQFIKTALRTEGYSGTQIFDRYYTVADLITLYFKELKIRAEEILGEKVGGVTIGRPVRFSQSSEHDMKAEETLRRAAEESGFHQVKFEYEPIAAALFYELTLERNENVLVFDFGGGTLDITIMRLGNIHHRNVFANGGIDIAGSDFDQAIIRNRLLHHFGKGKVHHLHEIDQLIDSISDWMALPELSLPRQRQLIKKAIANGDSPAQLKTLEALIFNDLAFSFYNAVEKAKIELSSQGASIISLKDKDIDIWELYTRWQFEKDIIDYQTQIEKVVIETVNNSGLGFQEIDAVVKTGGSSSIPLFTYMLEKFFGKNKIKESNTFSSVSGGLAICAAR